MVGQRVSVQNQESGHWNTAVVKEKCTEPRSYIIETPNGRQLRRNRNHLRDINPVKSVHFEDEPTKSKPVTEQPQSSGYRTRSGRTTNPPQRFIQEC